jgi:hypothetical protein
MPWIHVDDLCAIYLEAITNTQMNGAYNAAIMIILLIVFSLTHWLRFMGIKSVCPMSQVFWSRWFWRNVKDSIDGKKNFIWQTRGNRISLKHRNLEDTLRDCLSIIYLVNSQFILSKQSSFKRIN